MEQEFQALMRRAEQADRVAADKLFALLYRELHRLAEYHLRRGGTSLSLGTTTLLHEAYLDIARRENVVFVDRSRFLAYASRAMRGLVIDYARSRRAVGAEVVALAQSDRFDAVWTGTVPTRPGKWSSDFDPPRPPQLPLLGQMRPFFMESGDQFRPPAPPAFLSPEFLAALAEVRRLSDNRTPDQLRIANYWALTTGSLTAGFWNEEVTKRIARYSLNERRAAHALALVHMAAMDATIACYDAKYEYWLIRPYRVDAAITTPVGRPNHPSYPSSHGCSSSAVAYVLSALFPADADQLAAMADEAGESRLYAGLHYRFDKDAALRIGRQVADLALSRGVDGVR